MRARIAERLPQAREAGDLIQADPALLADFIETVLAGMSAHDPDGATHAQLEATVDRVIMVWPD